MSSGKWILIGTDNSSSGLIHYSTTVAEGSFTFQPSNDEWFFFAIVYDGADVTFYIMSKNGNTIESHTVSGGFGSISGIWIGTDSWNEWFHGSICHYRFWTDRLLTQSELIAEKNSSSVVSSTSLHCAFRMMTGTDFTDTSGNGFDGIPTSVTTDTNEPAFSGSPSASIVRKFLVTQSKIVSSFVRAARVIVARASSVSRRSWKVRKISYGNSTARSVKRIANYKRSLNKGGSISVVLSRIFRYLRTISFASAKSISVKRIGRYLRNVSFGKGIGIQVARLRRLLRIISFGKPITYVVSRIRNLSRAVRANLTSVFSVSRLRRIIRTIPEGISILARVQRLAWLKRTIATIRASVFSVARSTFVGIVTRTVRTIVASSYSVKRIARYIRNLQRIIANSVTVSRIGRFSRIARSNTTRLFSIARIKTIQRRINEIISTSISVKRIGRYLRSIPVTVSRSILTSRIASYSRNLFYYLFPVEIVISDDAGSAHGESVRSAVVYGYNYPNISNKTAIYGGSYTTDVSIAKTIRARLVVRSFSGVEFELVNSDSCYPSILSVWPLGSNSFVELTSLSSIPVSVTCGAGTTQNDTAYGNGLEFWDENNGGSSGAAGIVAGKLLKIKHSRGGSWWDARYSARATASNGGTWDKFNGYGKINVAAAIAYAGSIPADPYANSNVELGQINTHIVSQTWHGAIQTYIRNVVSSVSNSIQMSGNPILRLIYSIMSKFATKVVEYQTSTPRETKTFSSTTKEVE